MADNIALPSPATATVATDDVGGVHYQWIKLGFGAADAFTPVTSAAPLPVTADTELAAAETLGDGMSTGPTVPRVGAQLLALDAVAGSVVRLRTVPTGFSLVAPTGALRTGLFVKDSTGNTGADVISGHALGDAETGKYNLATVLSVYNGSTYDKQRSANGAQGTTGTGLLGVAPLAYDNSTGNYNRVRAPMADAVGGTAFQEVVPGLYNESTVDRQRGNTHGTLLASAARTATTVSAAQTNYNARGVLLFVYVTGAGTGSITPKIEALNPLGTGTFYVASYNAITTTGSYVYVLYPGANATAPAATSGTASAVLSRSWDLVMQHADSSSWTYSVGHSLII